MYIEDDVFLTGSGTKLDQEEILGMVERVFPASSEELRVEVKKKLYVHAGGVFPRAPMFRFLQLLQSRTHSPLALWSADGHEEFPLRPVSPRTNITRPSHGPRGARNEQNKTHVCRKESSKFDFFKPYTL